MSLYYYYHKMVEMKYWKMQIHVLTYFNHNLNLIHYLSHNFQICLGKLKVKAYSKLRNGSGGISNKRVSDKVLSLLCYLLQYELIVCYSSYLSLFMYFFFTLQRTQRYLYLYVSYFFTLQITQRWKITRINHLPNNWLQYIPKKNFHC